MQPFMECPSYPKCSANKCPLDPRIEERDYVKGEERCKAEKPTRLRIAAKYPDLLRLVGLFKREFQARERWNALDPTKRAERLQALTNARKSLPARLQGGTIEKLATEGGAL